MVDAAEARRRADEEARLAAEAALRAAEDKRKAEDEARRRAELEAERRRRAEDEEQKRAERKRKEDERRAKAKAERDARNKVTGAGGVSVSRKDDGGDGGSGNAGRERRIRRVHDALPGALQHVRDLAATSATVDDFLAQLVAFLGNGNVLFHTAVYVAVVDASAPATHVRYVAASANCSEKLRSGAATLSSADSTTLAALAANPRAPIGPVPCGAKELVHVGGGPGEAWPPASGDAAFFPIAVPGAAGNATLWGVLAVDTAQSNALDPVATFQLPDEDGCYSVEGDLRMCHEPVALSPDVVAFLAEVAGVASSAAAALPSAAAAASGGAAAAAAAGAPFGLDLECLRAAPNLGNLLARFTHLLRGAVQAASGVSVDCYVSVIATDAAAPSATVVAQNGFSIADAASAADRDPAAPHHLVGGKLTAPGARTFHLATTANSFTLVPDVAADTACALFDKSKGKPSGEALLLVPIVVSAAGGDGDGDDSGARAVVWGAVGVSGASASLTAELAGAIARLFWDHVRALVAAALRRNALAATCEQAIEWLVAATGCRNVYIALTHARDRRNAAQLGAAPLEIVKSSDAQRFLEGKLWTAGDGGVSHAFASGSVGHTHEAAATARHLTSLSGAAAGGVKFWNAALKGTPAAEKAQLVMCAIAQARPDAAVHGVLYGDTLSGDAEQQQQQLSAADVEVFRLTAQILAAALDGDPPAAGGPPLAIEGEAAGGVAFLLRMYHHAAASVRGITSGQLTELSRYPAPPPVIPKVVAAATVLLGAGKAAGEDWPALRKRVKQSLVDDIEAFDPTGPKLKKANVVRARALSKGLTAGDVFTKGSFPASCLFTWVFVSLLLRRYAKTARDHRADEQSRIAAALTSTTSSSSAAGADDEGADAPNTTLDDDGDDNDDADAADDGHD
jgi:hypothetical protein